jgi:hypothetical protein
MTETIVTYTPQTDSSDYVTGMVYGYLLKFGRPELTLKIGQIATGLQLTPEQVSSALDELKAAGKVGMVVTAAVVRMSSTATGIHEADDIHEVDSTAADSTAETAKDGSAPRTLYFVRFEDNGKTLVGRYNQRLYLVATEDYEPLINRGFSS